MAEVGSSHVGALETLVVDRVRRIVDNVEELAVVRAVERIGENLNEAQLTKVDGERARVETTYAVVVEVDAANGGLEAAEGAVVNPRDAIG